MLWFTWRRLRVARSTDDRRNQFSILKQLALISLPGLLLGGTVVGLAQVFSTLIAQAPNSVPAFGLIEHLRASPGSAYDALLTTVPTVAGVLLGLYYGALATLIGSRYGRVPGEIRSLVASEPAGTTYAGLLALAIGVSLFLLGLQASGATPTRLHTYVLLAVSVVALYAFAALGRRVFDFLDPTRLVIPVVPDFLVAAQQATTRGYRYETEEYQALYQRQAAYQLDLLDMLFDLAQPEEAGHGQRLVALAQYVPALLSQYLSLRPAIPGASRWYPRTARQRRWYLSDYTVQELALATRTSLQFEEGVDTSWVEQRVLGLVERQIVVAANRQDWELVRDLLGVLGSCNRAMGRAWSTTLAHDINDSVSNVVLTKLPLTAMPAEAAFQIAVVTDLLGMAQLDLLLGFGERVREMAKVEVLAAVERVDWANRRSIYAFPAAFALADDLESFRTQLGFERDVYGKQVTPSWFVAEELARQLVSSVKESIEPLVLEAERALPTVPGGEDNIERTQVLGALASRKTEYVAKLGYVVEAANELVAKLKVLDRSHDRKWANWQ